MMFLTLIVVQMHLVCGTQELPGRAVQRLGASPEKGFTMSAPNARNNSSSYADPYTTSSGTGSNGNQPRGETAIEIAPELLDASPDKTVRGSALAVNRARRAFIAKGKTGKRRRKKREHLEKKCRMTAWGIFKLGIDFFGAMSGLWVYKLMTDGTLPWFYVWPIKAWYQTGCDTSPWGGASVVHPDDFVTVNAECMTEYRAKVAEEHEDVANDVFGVLNPALMCSEVTVPVDNLVGDYSDADVVDGQLQSPCGFYGAVSAAGDLWNDTFYMTAAFGTTFCLVHVIQSWIWPNQKETDVVNRFFQNLCCKCSCYCCGCWFPQCRNGKACCGTVDRNSCRLCAPCYNNVGCPADCTCDLCCEDVSEDEEPLMS